VTGLGGLDLHELVDDSVGLEQVGVSCFADFTLEGLPVHAGQVLRLFLLELGCEPTLEALEMNESHGSRTLAGHNAWVFDSRFRAPAESAAAWVSLVGIESHHGSCLFQLLLVEFIGCLAHELALEILDSELYSPELDHVKLPDLVVLSKNQRERELTYLPSCVLRDLITSQSRSTLSSSIKSLVSE
jgi:hypothetical protein